MSEQELTVIDALEGKHYDIGLAGVWYGGNYGSVVTYFALYCFLKKIGYSVLMIDKANWKINDPELLINSHQRAFALKHYEAISPSLKDQDMKLLNRYCDAFIIGSDQVWNYGIAKDTGFNNYLDYAADDKKILSYASSFGHNTSFTPLEAISSVTKYLHRFDLISVREAEAVTVLKNEFGIEGTQVLDPVFLLNPDEYDDVLADARVTETEKFMLSYILDPTPEIREALIYAAKKKNLKLINLLDGRGNFQKNKEIMDLPNIVEKLNTPDWLWYFKNADFVITDSCHGTSFAIEFERPFICIANKKRGISRFESLVDLFEIHHRYVPDVSKLLHDPKLLQDMDFSRIREILNMERERSGKWLEEALAKEKETYWNVKCVVKKECCGCGSCYNTCPVDAIVMDYDEEGILYPFVDEGKCIQCKKCLKACPALHPVLNNAESPDCYAAFGNDELRQVSSSGGIFTLAAEQVLQAGGAVCGAAFNDKFELSQEVIYSEQDMPKLRGSKYIQSDTKETYQEIKAVLEQGKPALYVGCGCQVAGLKSFLGKEHEKLLTIDLLCHGGPSPEAFRKYLEEVHGNKKIEYIGFRDKDHFGWIAGMTVKYADGTVYREAKTDDLFYKAFNPCMAVRPHCQVCNYSSLPRQGDFTLGDFWGVDKLNPAYTDGKGTSILVVNNQKGKDLLEKIKDKLMLLEKVDINYILTHGQPFARPFRSSTRRYQFLRMLQNCSYKKAVESSTANEFDFGILDMSSDSYGEILSYYAVYQAVSKMNYAVLMVKRPKEMPHRITPLKYRLTNFANRYYPMVSSHDSVTTLKKLNETCHNFIAGIKNQHHETYLDFIDDKKTIVNYSDSNEENFDALFLLDAKEYEYLIGKSTLKPEREYISYYGQNIRSDILSKIRKYAEQSSMELIDLNQDMLVEDWLMLLKNSKVFFTNQREGADLGVLLNVPMLLPLNADDDFLRQYFRKIGLENRIISMGTGIGTDIEDAVIKLNNLNYLEVNDIIARERKNVMKRLSKNLKKASQKNEVGRQSIIKRGVKKLLRIVKKHLPNSWKEKLKPILKKNKFFNRYIKPL